MAVEKQFANGGFDMGFVKDFVEPVRRYLARRRRIREMCRRRRYLYGAKKK